MINGKKRPKNRLKKIRDEKGLSTDKVANDLGVQRKTLKNWENGETSPKLNDAIMLADYYGVSLEYIAMRDSYKSYETRSICETTGLSERSAQLFIDYKKRTASIEKWERERPDLQDFPSVEKQNEAVKLYLDSYSSIGKRYAHVPHSLIDVIETLLNSCYTKSTSDNIFDLIYKYVTNVSLENVDIVYNSVISPQGITRKNIASITPETYDKVYLDVNRDPFNSHKLSDLVEEAQVRNILNKLSEIRTGYLQKEGTNNGKH